MKEQNELKRQKAKLAENVGNQRKATWKIILNGNKDYKRE